MSNGIALPDTEIKAYITKVEAKLKQTMFSPENAGAVRFLVAQILLKAIALTKDPKTDPGRVKDLFELASEILAQGELKTDADEHRLHDLINAMVEQDDLGVAIRSFNREHSKNFKLLQETLEYNFKTAKEERIHLTGEINYIKLALQKLSLRHSTIRTFFVILAALAFLIFSVMTTGTIIAYMMNKASQPDFQEELQRQQYKPAEIGKVKP